MRGLFPFHREMWVGWAVVALLLLTFPQRTLGEPVDFNRDIRPLISKNCLACHGPDEEQRQGDLRLDISGGAHADRGGYAAVVPGKPEKSELLRRLTTSDVDERMPPDGSGRQLNADEVELIRRWIEQGAVYSVHWSYAPPVKVDPPAIGDASWSHNEVDRFLSARLEREGLQPAPPASRRTLARRVALDLTGLPPTWEEVERFINDTQANAIERFVDQKLREPSFGEHWARMWLDLARYADSSGYPSDQPRQIWGYRDWVIDAINRNLPFDRFTVEQIAGDLLPDPTDGQLIATAFHRNTMTQNEGGTSDEEYRVAAVIDRVNTTMAVWMGTTIACAQCHTHKYDPITQQEYFEFYAILNQSADADRKDEAPLHKFFTSEQAKRRAGLQDELAELEKNFSNPRPEVLGGLAEWEQSLPLRAVWQNPKPSAARSAAGAKLAISVDGRIQVEQPEAETDTTTIDVPIAPGRLGAVRVEALADEGLPGGGPGHAAGNFVLSSVRAELVPQEAAEVRAKRLRIELVSDKYDFLALAEVQVFSRGQNVALLGAADQISTFKNGSAEFAIDGNTDGDSASGKSVSITGGGTEPQWWEVEFDADRPIDRIVVWRRTDKGQGRQIDHLKLKLSDGAGKVVWHGAHEKEFGPREEVTVNGCRSVQFDRAFADASQDGYHAADVLNERSAKDKGWAVGGFTGTDSALTLVPASPIEVSDSKRLRLTLVQASKHPHHTLGSFRVGITRDPSMSRLAEVPRDVLAALAVLDGDRTSVQRATIHDHYVRHVAPQLNSQRERYSELEAGLAEIVAATVPIMTDLAEAERRETHLQRRGSWKDLGQRVDPGLPAAFPPLPPGAPHNRLGLAQWLVSPTNPLTARVTVNRFWEAIFGVGIVRTSEEFGAQGERPLHPELLDWLALDFVEHGWDVKRLLKQLVMSRAYQQESRVTPELNERDPDNRLLARGPRFRPTGEALRDQALAVSGLLNGKIGGPAVRPLAPNTGLNTAFGRSHDWTTSEGEDRHRRSLYTEVRRNSPYASFSTFDGPNREVCTIRRGRTNTPLQAFVTLNDPVFVEAHQALARRLVTETNDGTAGRLRRAFRICLSREPTENESAVLTKLIDQSLIIFRTDPASAAKLATEPLGPAPDGSDLAELAAWTVAANVIMNLDEFLMRR
jgi:hypothetical protein